MRQTLEDIRRKLAERVYRNEEHVRLSLVARILNELGWDLWNPAEFNTEFVAVPTEDNTRVDIALFLSPYVPTVYVEVKTVGKLNGDISSIELQLRDYNRNNTAVFSVMTDGRKWRFYYSQTGGEFSNKCFKTLDLLEDDYEELEAAFQSFLSKTELSNENAKRSAEAYLQRSQKQRAMEDVLPQARKIVMEPPYPSLPQAVVELVETRGLSITPGEASQFIRDFTLRKPSSEPVISNRTIIPVQKRQPKRSEIPMALADVLDVCHEVFENARSFRDACKVITEKRNLNSTGTVPNACTRAINIDTAGFMELLQNRARLVHHLVKHYPGYENAIREVLG